MFFFIQGEIMMIEADVVMGTVTGSPEVVPIMAHPPANQSELSLSQFLAIALAAGQTKKGIKLDFKTIEAFENATTVLNTLANVSIRMCFIISTVKNWTEL